MAPELTETSLFHGNEHQPGTAPAPTPAPTPVVGPGSYDEAGLGRLWAACVAAERARPSAATLRDYLATHRVVWDMPSLCEVFPEVTEHLEARYHLEHHPGGVRVTPAAAATAGCAGPEVFPVDDVRQVVDVLLSREYREAVCRESVRPAGDRLVG
ncbi:hypothetical protein [Nocardioides rubriscoriae]|uniref:hypothetical protein n=1 Tax=Nocardioides rubriscoriae TaxID=642762 RepID=UPI00147820A6|nr:hypothetical protein [Nocardioides rubriscoriae]